MGVPVMRSFEKTRFRAGCQTERVSTDPAKLRLANVCKVYSNQRHVGCLPNRSNSKSSVPDQSGRFILRACALSPVGPSRLGLVPMWVDHLYFPKLIPHQPQCCRCPAPAERCRAVAADGV